MKSLHVTMKLFRKELEKGIIQDAYQGLLRYILNLKTHLKKKYPDHYVSGSIYQGYMDMTYFSFFSESLKKRKLKTGIVFNFEAFRFEAWLFAVNKRVQKKYWELFKETGWTRYSLVESIEGADSILEHVLVHNPTFEDLDGLTDQIEEGILLFIEDVESFLSNQKV